jgi:small glutamine-rich tetratricopeptide repeat-containing protein alpha
MDKTRVARSLIVQYLESCAADDPEHAEEYTVSVECLKTIWDLDSSSVSVPGIRSLLDLLPEQVYDRERAIQLKLDGNNALRTGNLDLAIAKYTEAIAVDPTEATFYCNRAAVHSRQGNHEIAIADCEKAISLDPKYATAYSRLGFAYFSTDQRDKAREAYERGIRVCPDNQALKDNLNSLGPEPAAAGGAAPDLGAMFGAFANNPMFAGIADRLKSPEVQAVLQEPEMAALVAELQANPSAIMAKMGDPRMQRLFGLLMGGGPRQ